MKKLLTFFTVLLLFSSILFSNSSVTVNLTAFIPYTPEDSGIKVLDGDWTGQITNKILFEDAYNNAEEHISKILTVDNQVDNTLVGYFTVLVKRGRSYPLGIMIFGSPLKMIDRERYLGYSLEQVDNDEVVYSNYFNVVYEADRLMDGVIRDVRAFRCIIPISNDTEMGEYSTILTFAIVSP